MAMEKKEVKNAIEFRKPNSVPIMTENIAGEVRRKYGQALEEILKKYPNDFSVVFYEGTDADESGIDEWGCVWGEVEGGVGEQVVGHPLDNWEKLKEYKFPDLDSAGRFDTAKKEIEKNREIYTIGCAFSTLFERMHFLRGYTKFLEDLYLERDRVSRLADRIMEFEIAIIGKWAELEVDCVMLGDDWGTQESLMINPQIWREVFKPRYRKIIDSAHNQNMHVFFHSCGNIREVTGDFIEIGVDILNPIQPNAMDVEEVGKTFSGKTCFCGSIDTHGTMRLGKPGDVTEEVRNRIETLGTENGGYICTSATTILPDIPLENIEALFQAAKEYSYK